MGTTVDDLINRPFLSRSRQEMYKIIADGKPQPILNMAAVVVENDSDVPEMQTHHFTPEIYEQIPWLTACEKRESVFCWPCLLFSPSSPWSTTGISDFEYVIEGTHNHEESPDHVKATLQMKDLVELNVPTPNEDGKQHSESVKRNRAILKRLCDIVCNLLFKERPHNERKNGCQISPDSCVRSLEFLRNFDGLNTKYIEDAIDWINKSPNIVNDLVDTISELIKSRIKEEIRSSPYVSVILSDHAHVSAMSQISTVLRYIKDGKIYERFLGFRNLDNIKYPSTICQHISNLVNEFEFSEKFIAFSLDGSVLSLSDLPELTAEVKTLYPYASFVPWYGHDLDQVLLQSFSSVKSCIPFFKTINDLKVCLQKDSEWCEALEIFMDKNEPGLDRSQWFDESQMISFLSAYRKKLISFVQFIRQNSYDWNADEVAKAVGFQKTMRDFKTVFLLQAFSLMFKYTSTLSNILKSTLSENVFDDEIALKLAVALEKERDYGFEEAWTHIQFDMCDEDVELRPKKLKLDDDPETKEYRELYDLIFDHAIHVIYIRFIHLEKLKFCHLLKLDECVDVTNDMLQQLRILYGSDFDEELVKSEILVLRANNAAFKDKSANDLFQLFSHSKLKNTFKCVHKITQFLFTLPIKPASEDTNASKLQDITDWSYIPTESGVTPGDVSIPCVELNLLQDLKRSNSFHDDVFDNFLKGAKTFELLQK